jgi:hypothetical protein
MDVDSFAHDRDRAMKQRSNFLTRGRVVGLAGVLVMTAAYFGTVVWLGNGLAEDMKAGTRQITAGQMVPDSEG